MVVTHVYPVLKFLRFYKPLWISHFPLVLKQSSHLHIDFQPFFTLCWGHPFRLSSPSPWGYSVSHHVIDSVLESIRRHIVKWVPLAHVGSPIHKAVGSTEKALDFLLCSHSSLRNNCSNMSRAIFLNLSARFQVFDFQEYFLFGVFPLPLSRDFSTHSLALTFALFLESDSGSHQLLLFAVLINTLRYRIGFGPCDLNDKYSSLEPCLTLEILQYSSPSQLTGQSSLCPLKSLPVFMH